MSEGFYLRKEVAFSSPQQSISKSGTSNYMLKNRYNKMMDAGSMYGTVPAGGADRARNIRSSLNRGAASGRGGRQLQKEGLQVDVNELGDGQDFRVMSGPSSRRVLEAKKASTRQQEPLYSHNDRAGRVKSAVNKHQVLSENSQRHIKENFKSHDKLTNVSSAKSIRLDRAIKRMSVDPVPFFKVA